MSRLSYRTIARPVETPPWDFDRKLSCFYAGGCRSRIRLQRTPAIPQIASKGSKLANPCSPISWPRLNAPNPLPASAGVSIDSRFSAIWPDQNAGHDECTIGQLSCIANCDVVETTISVTNTLTTAKPSRTRRQCADAFW